MAVLLQLAHAIGQDADGRLARRGAGMSLFAAYLEIHSCPSLLCHAYVDNRRIHSWKETLHDEHSLVENETELLLIAQLYLQLLGDVFRALVSRHLLVVSESDVEGALWSSALRDHEFERLQYAEDLVLAVDGSAAKDGVAVDDASVERCPYIAPSDHLTRITNQKLEKLKDAYCQTLKFYVGLRQTQPGSLATPTTRTAAFAIRNRGKATPDKATLSYIIFAAQSLFLLDKAKFAFQRVSSPRPSEMGAPRNGDLVERSRESLYFSNYFHFQGIDVQLGRQFSFEEEADVIHAKFAGKSDVRLGEVRRFVLEETGFPYHTSALRILETQGKIVSVMTGEGGTRQRGMFPQRVPVDHRGTEEGNHWRLCFSS